jgi:hypothetical protein
MNKRTRNTRRNNAEPQRRCRITSGPHPSYPRGVHLSVSDERGKSVLSIATRGDGRIEYACITAWLPDLAPHKNTHLLVNGSDARRLAADILGPLDFALTRRTPAALAEAA